MSANFDPFYHDPNSTRWDGNPYHWWFGDKRHFRPWYDNNADYNTNAKSYYDYLGFRIKLLDEIVDQINKVLARDLQVKDTSTISITKEGDWQKQDDIINLSARAKLSTNSKNAIKDNNGLYAYDYGDDINDLKNRVGNLEDRVDKLEDKVNNLQNQNNQLQSALEKIINRMTEQGAWTGGLAGDFVPDQSLATGNINVYGISRSSNKLLKTHTGDRDGDIIQGLD